MNNIKLSICIPTYNFGEYIGQTLQSVIEQASDEIEIIVGDGASTDNTEEVVMQYRKEFTRLTYVNFKTKGGIDSDLAKTIQLAKGDYCWLLSSDDVIKPGAIKRVLDELVDENTVYLCNRTICNKDLIKIDQRYWLKSRIEDSVYTLSTKEEKLKYFNSAISLGALFSYISTLIIKRSAWLEIEENIAVSNTNYAHVYKLFSMIQNRGNLKYIKDPLVLARFFNDSFMINGVVKRYLIDLNGYHILAEQLFKDMEIKKSFMSVLRREHKWYILTGLAEKVTNKLEWDLLSKKFAHYGYSRVILYVVWRVGRNKFIMASLRRIKRMLLR